MNKICSLKININLLNFTQNHNLIGTFPLRKCHQPFCGHGNQPVSDITPEGGCQECEGVVVECTAVGAHHSLALGGHHSIPVCLSHKPHSVLTFLLSLSLPQALPTVQQSMT